MNADEIARLIPPEVVEAAAMILHANNEVLEDVPWEDLGEYDQDTYRDEARAAIAAALASWPGMQRRPSGAYYAIVWDAHLVLPLPDKGAPTQGDACNG